MSASALDIVDFLWITLFIGGPLALTAAVIYLIGKDDETENQGDDNEKLQ